MWDDLRPITLTQAAKQLGVDPFEVMRLLVAADAVPVGAPVLSAEAVEQLRAVGQLQPSWWPGAQLPDDPHPRRARVRAALSLLLERGYVGDVVTRLDNVTRGLRAEEQRLILAALRALAEVGLVRIEVRPIGVMVAVEADHADRVRSVAAGNEMPAVLHRLLEG